MKCKSVSQHLSAHVNRELTERTEALVAQHLQSCPRCAQELAMLEQITAEAGSLRKQGAPDSLWLAIERELDTEKQPAIPALLAKIKLAGQDMLDRIAIPAPALKVAGVIAVLLLGIVIGRNFQSAGDEVTLEQPGRALPKAEFVSRTSAYIEKSKVLFLGVVNADAETIQNSNWTSERKLADGLVREATFLKENLPASRNARLKQLIEELELILWEIANLEEREDIKNIDLIKSGIDRKGLLLKINLFDPEREAVSGRTLM